VVLGYPVIRFRAEHINMPNMDSGC